MKFITPPFMKFTGSILLLTIAFRAVLTYTLQHQLFVGVIVTALLYGLMMFGCGFYFGKKDAEYLPILDVGFRTNLTTFLICNGVGELWFAFHLNAPADSLYGLRLTELIWGALLVIHFIIFLLCRRNAINSLDKTDLFD